MSDTKKNEPGEYQPVAGAPVPIDYQAPTHEETLGALPGVPKEVAEEYARTGRTPKQYVDQVRKSEETARAAGLKANPGTAGQSRFPEDQERDAKDQQREQQQRQRDQQRESNEAGNRQQRAARPQ